MKDKFEMILLRKLAFFLVLQVKQLDSKIFVSQAKYIKELLKRFEMESWSAVSTAMSSSFKLVIKA